MSSNPLLDFSDLPLFDRITPQDVAPAMDVLLERANQALETVTAPDFPAEDSAARRFGTGYSDTPSHYGTIRCDRRVGVRPLLE